jgi:archaeosine synthase beta-subunit
VSRTEPASVPYPAAGAERDRFVLARRGPRTRHDPWRHQGLLVEEERSADGRVARSATIFLTGRECPWRCVMCDLWRYTIAEDTPPGAIPHQIGLAIQDLCAASEPFPTLLKLYNAGSFFDPRAVPAADYEAIASGVARFNQVVVESHPAMVGERVERFAAALRSRSGSAATLEVAMGLETAHPGALEQLHKRMTLDDFARAAGWLRDRDVRLRVFLLVFPPFIPADEQDEWLLRSLHAAFDCGASVVSLIPSRLGNGALDALMAEGLFRKPTLADLERVFAAALALGRGRVFVDLWDLDRVASCRDCIERRRERLHRMNLGQLVLPPISCTRCAAGTA